MAAAGVREDRNKMTALTRPDTSGHPLPKGEGLGDEEDARNEMIIKTDEWTERKTSAQRQLLRAQVRRAALEEYYERQIRSRAESTGADAIQLLVSGAAAEEMSALEEELDDARNDFDLADARQKLLVERMPEGKEAAADEEEDSGGHSAGIL